MWCRSTKQRRAAQHRRAVVQSVRINGEGVRWLPAIEVYRRRHRISMKRLRAQGWRREWWRDGWVQQSVVAAQEKLRAQILQAYKDGCNVTPVPLIGLLRQLKAFADEVQSGKHPLPDDPDKLIDPKVWPHWNETP